MDLAVGAVGAVADLLLHSKAKLTRTDMPGESGGGGLGGALSAAASALPIPGLGAEDKENEISCMFNPTEYSLSQGVEITRKNKKWTAGGSLEYLYTKPMTLTMELFFDDFASAAGDVTPKINKLLSWQRPAGTRKPPPFVKFEWKNPELDSFEGILTSVDVKYSVFRKDGTPIQARANITIEGTRKSAPGKNPTSHSVDMRHVHTVIEGETLHAVAQAEFGRPGYWRALAEANGIDDPLRVRPGRTLLIPSAADAARSA